LHFLVEDDRSQSIHPTSSIVCFVNTSKTRWDHDGAQKRIDLDKSTDPAGESGSNQGTKHLEAKARQTKAEKFERLSD
jgi:hypothetical protein